MKQYTRRSALKLLGIGTVTIAGFGLAGCSGSGEGVKNASEPVPASQAFGQAGVWMVYDGDKQIGKDVAIEEVLSFDGNGNVASYQCKSLTFGDLDGLSDDEIIELAKQQDEAAFNAAKQAAIDATDEAIQAWQQCYDTLKAEADAGTYDSIGYYGDYGIENVPEEDRAQVVETYQTTLDNTQDALDAANKGQAFNKAAAYQEPEAKPYTLRLETDGSGNAAANESLVLQRAKFSLDPPNKKLVENHRTTATTPISNLVDYGWDNNAEIPDSAFGSTKKSIELCSPTYSTTQTVYGTTFGGYSGLATVVNEGHAGFTWDTPDTEGIEVD